MKKNIKKTLSISLLMLSSASYASGFVAIVQNKQPITINKLTEEPSVEPLAVNILNCTWGECIGAYNNNQAFYINGKGPGSAILTEETGFDKTTKVFASSNYLFIENNSFVYGKGYNGYGSLGVNINSSTTNVTNFTKLVGLSGEVKDILPGRVTIARTTNGLYFAGDNQLNGGLPLDPTRTTGAEYITFQKFIDSSTITGATTLQDAFAYTDNGKLYVIGENNEGMFGLGDSEIDVVYKTYQEVSELTGVTDVFIAKNDSSRARMFIVKDGNIWAAGSDTNIIGLDIVETDITEFRDTGFKVNKLNMFGARNTTYLIKEGKLYFSGSDDFSGGATSKEFSIVESTKEMNFKYFIGDENEVYVLREDGKTISVDHGASEGSESYLINDFPFFVN